jgi:hypothetical protein
VPASKSLAADLADLTRLVENPDVDLAGQLRAVVTAAKFAIDSYLGMTLTIVVDGEPVSVTARDEVDTQVATSLRIPLAPASDAGTGNTLTLYAGTAGALVDLGADLSYALRLPLTALVFDDRISEPVDEQGVTGRDTQAALNRAIGVLIDRGNSPEAAREQLHQQAVGNGDNMRIIAEQVLRSAMRDPDRDAP